LFYSSLFCLCSDGVYVASDNEYIAEDQFRSVSNLAEETSRIIGGLRVAVQKQKDKENEK